MEILSKGQFVKIVRFARENCARNDFNHNLDHMEKTVRIARWLAVKERANLELCLVGAYLHDIARSRTKGKHGKFGAQMAREFLRGLNLPPGFIRDVCYIVDEHDRGGRKRIKEAGVVWDADKLQAIGPWGFVRILTHHLAYDTSDVSAASLRAKKKQDFFMPRFHTPAGKLLARSLHSLVGEFFSAFQTIEESGDLDQLLKRLKTRKDSRC